MEKELDGTSYVIVFGADAELALKTGEISHLKAMCLLGTKDLNYIYGDDKEEKNKRIADDFISQLNSKD